MNAPVIQPIAASIASDPTSSPKRPALRYHGGKWRLAPWIIAHFPRHRVYVEPFGGGAGVLLRKPRSYAEIYNDLDGDVVGLFSTLRDRAAAEELIRLVSLTPYARQEFELSYQPSDDPLERARRFLFRLDWYRTNVFGQDLRFPLEWRLTRTESRLLAALLSPLPYMTPDALMTAMYGDRPDDEPDRKIISVLILRLRRKLKPRAIEIRTAHGYGYSIPSPRRHELRLAARILSSPPWEHPSVPLPALHPCAAARIAAQDRSALA